MPHSKLLTGAFAATALLWAACNPTAAPRQPPKIVFHEATYDFGHAEQGTTITHRYTFRNDGGLDLAVDNVRASCDCTAVAPPARLVPPGAQGTIEVRLDTMRDFGHKTRTITVYSNDPAQPVTTLALVGTVDTEVAADPPSLYVGHLARGQTAPNEVRVRAASNVAVGPVIRSGHVVDAILSDADRGAKRLRVAVKHDAPPGRFNDSVAVRTTSARRPVVTIAVAGIVDDVAASAHPLEKQQ